MASSSSFLYDVFLSFRGTDTRYGFTGNLNKALRDKGISTFIDDKELQKGGEITTSLLEAIQQSRIAIIVLSANYASSSFCLEELSNIIHHINNIESRKVFPIFYKVDPSHVRKQTETFGKALVDHEEKFKANKDKLEDNMKRLQKWRTALEQVANLSGFHFKDGDEYEHKFIENIVKEVSKNIKRVPLPFANHPIGLESRVEEVVKLLMDAGSNDGVDMVGIHGIGGVGKTTLVLAVYNFVAENFEGLCFLHNVRENSNTHGGLRHLQEILLGEMFGGGEIKLASVLQGSSEIQRRLRVKKVLLILDDVDKPEQLQALAGSPDWFGPGSRVIITTRDKQLLACHEVKKTYEVNGLNGKDALKLLSWKAFKTHEVDQRFNNILNRALTFAAGLPLALEVIGSSLFGKSVDEWKSALDRYERIPIKEIQKKLEVSFDALEEEEKSVFLDIACCFKGYLMTKVQDILCAHHGHCMKYHIQVLIQKSLIKIGYDWHSKEEVVTLHDLIEDMGKEIVRRESPNNPGERSRLWVDEDIVDVLEEDKVKYLAPIPSSIVNMQELAVIWGFDWELGSLREVGSMVSSSNVECLFLLDCNVSDEFLAIGLTWFAKVKKLYLPRNNLTIIPECIKECRLLTTLNMDYCKSLREIGGIPPKLRRFSARYCSSLTSESISKLTDQKLHEAANTRFRLPGTIGIPELFEHINSRGRSISFWFRNKFPTIAICLVNVTYYRVTVVINGNNSGFIAPWLRMSPNHTYLFGMQPKDIHRDGVTLKNEWNRVKVTCRSFRKRDNNGEIGIHVFKEKNSKEDILFSNPCPESNSEDGDIGDEETLYDSYSEDSLYDCHSEDSFYDSDSEDSEDTRERGLDSDGEESLVQRKRRKTHG
ncbi:TMV resistance protein N-like [Gastrolobium bilobum]|uniref:TMV resistance protein N-like n=1 Tax=Gastrolobium bilobum TaxID=150636 RepID=UPI002AB1175D|nr:TMV resistance protein N-like [Gastrolobium bilobum]